MVEDCKEEVVQNVSGIGFLEKSFKKLADKIPGLKLEDEEEESNDYPFGRLAVPYEYLVFEEEEDEFPETA